MKYKVGDKVRIVKKKNGACWDPYNEMDKWLGEIMTIRYVCNRYYKMEEDISEHNGSGWTWHEDMIQGLACPPSIEISTDGVNTYAQLQEGWFIKQTSVAKCNPNDEFDFKIGVELALKRLFENIFEVSKDEYVILKNIPKKWAKGYLARDKDDYLCIFTAKPNKGDISWANGAYAAINVFNHLFPYVKWEDSEPTKISDLIKKYEEVHGICS